jgi:predicted nucleic acid-binding protein
MILVDTSVWIDHLRVGDEQLATLLNEGEILTHPFVIGEVALGNLRRREAEIAILLDLPQVYIAGDEEVRELIERYRLFGLGIGYVDAHLLTAAKLTPETAIWTRDRRFTGAASRVGLATRLPH